MSSTFDRVADIIAETSEIDRDQITPESHTIDDLGIDSLDFLDIVFAIDKEFGIKIPLEKWTQEVNDGEAPTEEYFVLKNLCAKIDELRAAKVAELILAIIDQRSGAFDGRSTVAGGSDTLRRHKSPHAGVAARLGRHPFE